VIAALVLGAVGPLVVALGSWKLVERTWRSEPSRLTAMMIAAFAGKLVFFAVYVAVMLSVLSLPPTPFIASFTTSFIALHLAEALALRRLFSVSRDELS
jgi:hypothetical protein